MMAAFLCHRGQACCLQRIGDTSFYLFTVDAHIEKTESYVVEQRRHKQLVIWVLEADTQNGADFLQVFFSLNGLNALKLVLPINFKVSS